MDRPSQDLLNEFYKVVSCERSDRVSSIKRFLESEEVSIHAHYIVERLISGLSSARAASRHGFSVALTLLLPKLPNKFSLEKLFEIADKTLDVKLLETLGGVIAYQLLCTSCYLSGAYNREAATLVKKQLELASAHSFLSACVADSIVKFSVELSKTDEGKSIFKQQILPQIRFKICKAVEDLAPDEFLMISGLRSVSSKVLTKECPLIKNKRLVLAESDFPLLVEILKKADPTLKSRLILTILEVGRENGAFLDYFKNVFVEYAWHGDLSKAAERYFRLLNQICASPKIQLSELLVIFDAELIRNIRKYAHRVDPAFRGLHILIQSFLERVQTRLDETSCEDDDIQKLIFTDLELLDNVEGGEFDTKIGTHVKFSEFLVGKLRDDYFVRFLEKALASKADWSIRRFEHIYKLRNVSEKVKILHSLVEQAKSSEKVFEIVCSLLNGIFIIKFRRGVCLGSALSTAEDVDVLKQVSAMTRGKSENDATETEADKKFECLEILTCTLRILGSASNSPESRRDYLEAAREARRCARKYKSGALVDLLLSVLIHRNRVHKSLVFYVFCQLCDSQSVSAAEAKFIIDTIGKPDAEITGEGDAEDEDDDFKPITEAELKKLKKEKAANANGENESQDEVKNEADGGENEDEDEEMDDEDVAEESDDDGDEEEDMEEDEESEEDGDEEEVDAQLVSDVKNALGSAALALDADDDDDAEDENIENMDELHMKKLDAALADAFRRNSSKERKLRQEEIKTFRGKCLDLVNIFTCLASCADAREYQILCDSLSKAAKKLRQLRINDFHPKIESAIKSLTKRAVKLEAPSV